MSRFALAQETNGFAAASQRSRITAQLAALLRSLSGIGREKPRHFGSLGLAARHDSGAGRDLQDYAVAPTTASSRRLHAIAETASWTSPRL
ncbi:hypothetical protein [Pelagibius marinus]|uniref:hypothetical protein n=1 Tax=Pelagibius marinus TaxID=2762760 RepID=UPI0018721E54|nr:hypothetical protein [Pelagibius marinus]